ncbi:MAG: hypothetical protein CVU47_08610 [Chloroflexi bacterium HGW-Chloroflexi-9]|nr:MAG: hypothetical protein CVU47_08610 [Chloroflexi bacterium HGW-Chloroflexi-9]
MAPVLVALAIGLTLVLGGKQAEAAGPLDLCLGSGCSFTSTVYYVDWTTINVGGGTAAGTINLPSGPPVSVTLTAVNPDNTNGSFYGGQTGCGVNYWNPSAPYISPEVPNAPPACELVQLQGGQNQTYRMTFSQAVQDPLMAIVSLGSGGIPTTYDFDRPFTIVSQGAGYWGGDATRLVQLPGDILRGNEGHGTIRFIGAFPTFSWTVPTPEVWHGFTFGIRTTTALSGQQIVVNEGTTATNTGRWGGTDPTLTASIGTVVKNADGTWDWSFLTDDGPAQDQAVTITATENGSSVSQTFNLLVKNVLPWATLGNDGPKPVGVPITASFTDASDPSGADTSAGFHYAFDCNGGTLEGITYASTGPSASVQCTYATPGPVTITGRIIDKDNEDGSYDHTTTTTVITDVTPPEITPTVTGTLGSNDWYTSDIDVSWTVIDDESTVTSETGCDATTVTVDTAGVTFTCTATSAGGTASESVTVKRDATAPAVSLLGVTDGASYAVGTVPAAGCDTTDALSGVATAAAVTVTGGPGVGTYTATCDGATDEAGNAGAAVTATYQVTYAFCGFKQPLLVPVQQFKAGSTIPVKFCVQDGNGNHVATATGTVEAYVNGVLMATTFTIRYDASAQQYIANVQTKDGKVNWPTGTLELRVKLNDGTTHSTNALSTDGVKGGLKLR